MIKIIDLGNVEIDGVNAGDLLSAAFNYPDLLIELKAAAITYDNDRQGAINETVTEQAVLQSQQLIRELERENASLKSELVPDIQAIVYQLLDAGLMQWGQDAVSAVDDTMGKEIMTLVIQLKEIASESRSITQCDRIKEVFVTIGTISGVWPTSEQAAAMQAVLDIGPMTTGKVAEKYLSFTPWI